MGLRIGFSSSSNDSSVPLPQIEGNPRPERFQILRVAEYVPYVVAEVRWPDAKNYEGRKIMLYRANSAQLSCAKKLDPHFSERKGPLVPLARFEPTEAGWEAAQILASHFAILGEP